MLTQVIDGTREFEDADDPLQIDIDSISSSIRLNQAMETDAKETARLIAKPLTPPLKRSASTSWP